MNKAIDYFFASMISLIASSVEACDCIVRTETEQIESADVVLVANVVGGSSNAVELKPTEIFKGAANGIVSVKAGSSNCDTFFRGAPLKVGEQYLLFLTKENNVFVTNMCVGSGSTKSNGIQAELSALRARAQQAIPADRGERRRSR